MKRVLLTSTGLAGISLLAAPAIAQQQGGTASVAPESAVNDPTRSNAEVAAPTPGAPPAAAEAQGGLEDIVVTAQRRSENLQRAAIAVTAISGDTLTSAGITKPTELTSIVPALQVAPAAGPYTLFYLRGVGNFNGNALSDSAIAFNFDGVYIGRPSSTTGFFYDLERVEVVKGPQGTLYGRNATGGAINVISKRPDLDKFGAEVSGEYGNYDAYRIDGAINVPLAEGVAVRASGIRVRHDGYMNDGTDDQSDWGGRVSLRAEPSSALSINVVADYFKQRGDGVGSTPLGVAGGARTPATFEFKDRIGFLSPQGQAFYSSQPNVLLGRTFYQIPTTLRPYQDNEYWGVSSTIEWKTDLGTLTVIPAYRESDLNFRNFLPGFFIQQREHTRQSSVEGRFATTEDNPLRLLLGGFYYNEKTHDPAVTYLHQSNGSYQNLRLDTESEAVFGRVTYAITPEIRLSAGGRYTWEQKDFDGTLTAASRICLAPTSYFPVYTPGCPTAPQIPYVLTPPAPDFNPAPDGTITAPSFIDNSGANSRHTSFKRFTYRLGADWDVTDRNLLYASYETGFKSGGFFFSSDRGIFQPEKIRAFTVGSKNRFLDNRLQINLEGFYWRYKDQQVSHLSLDSKGIAIFPTENVGKATFKGFEAETRFLLTETTTLSADVQYLDAKYNSFVYTTPNQNGGFSNGTACPNGAAPGVVYTVNCSGFRPPNAPKWTLNLGGQQRIPLSSGASIVGDLRSHYQTRTLTGLEFQPIEFQRSYWTADAALTFYAPQRRFFVGGFVNNAFNKTVLAATFPTAFSFFYTGSLRPPRTYGIRAGAKF